MIKINLLKNQTAPRSVRSIRIPRVPPIVFVILGAAVIIGAGSVLFFRFAGKKPAPVAAAARAPKHVYKPTTHMTPGMLEDVVKEIGDDTGKSLENGFLDLSYDEMSTSEKINYEVLFIKYVTDMLGRSVPRGIGLRSLNVENFQTVYAVGIGRTKEQVGAMLLNLRKERIELLQPPYSYIKSNAGQGFRFVVTCKTRFGLDLTDPFQAIDYLTSREDVNLLLKKIVDSALKSNVQLTADPSAVSAERVGNYRRLLYHVEGNCAYKDFVKWTTQMYRDRIPCGFKKVDCVARSGASINVSADLLFTVRN